jgi:flagellar basal body rod protein FlgC|tara:strand:- start:340 stop:735 length:396 start_codon:yes stop_codon:yes gene_type:complete
MADPISTALSGLNASVARVAQAADNIANAGSRAPRPGADPKPGEFTPRDVRQSSTPGGGVSTTSVVRSPASLLAFSPGAPGAAEDGTVAIPNVDFAAEIVDTITARASYRAAAEVIKTADELEKEALDITT